MSDTLERSSKQVTHRRLSGLHAFAIIWLGQFISLLGTAMTSFALTVWAWYTTGQATTLALVEFFSFGTVVVFSPLAGALVDRWNRKLVMMLSDLTAGLITVVLLALYVTDALQIWHLYIAKVIIGAFMAFQLPAYSAAITLILPKQHYARASGMLSLALSGSSIFAPVLAALLVNTSGIASVMVIDVATCLVAAGAILLAHIPQLPPVDPGRERARSLWQESLYGFHYILARPSLLGLQLVFFFSNFLSMFGMLLPPMILARTGNNEFVLGSVLSASGIGGLAGGLLTSVLGGSKGHVQRIMFGLVLIGLLGQTLMGLGRSLPIWVSAAFLAAFFFPIIHGSNQAIWQMKVAPGLQGRVFAARRLIAEISGPTALLIAGPLADYVFEPSMSPGGVLADDFGWLVGSGPGSGMALLFVLSGLLVGLVGLVGYSIPAIRRLEELVPDHDMVARKPC